MRMNINPVIDLVRREMIAAMVVRRSRRKVLLINTGSFVVN